MSIVDIGTNDQRTDAMPNSHDTVDNRMADGTTSFTQKVDNQTDARIVSKDAKIVLHDNNDIPRIIIGIIPELDNVPVMAVSKDGIDVLDALGL